MISSINDHAGAAPPLRLKTSFPTAVTVNWKNSKFAKPGLMVATISPFHSTFTNAAASCAGGLNELDWKNPIEYCRPGIVTRGLAGVSVPGRASSASADPRSATAFPLCANGAKKKIVASSVPPGGLVPIQVLSESAKQKSSHCWKSSNPPSMTALMRW